MATSFDFGQAAPNAPRDRSSPAGSAGHPRKSFRLEHEYFRPLDRLVEAEIIPRLMVARSGEFPATSAAISAQDIEDFAPLALQVEADELIEHADRLLARGLSVEALLVDLLAPAARVLGEYWKADRCDFVDVTMALWRLQEVVHEITARMPGIRAMPGVARHALFAAMPGDQHGFGALVVEEVFARAGWITDRLGDVGLSDLYGRVSKEWFDLIGLTVSCDVHTGALPAAITAIRNVSRNPRLVVMVGGRVFVENPGLAVAVGANGTAADARAAVTVAEELVALTVREGMPCD